MIMMIMEILLLKLIDVEIATTITTTTIILMAKKNVLEITAVDTEENKINPSQVRIVCNGIKLMDIIANISNTIL
jgi:hypothetical protein